MDEDKKIIHKELCYKIVEMALEVHNELGCGFLEKVYENAMMLLFEREKIPAKQQAAANEFVFIRG